MFQSSVVDVVRSADRIEALVLQTKSGRVSVTTDVFIDASGDGDVAALAGVPWEKGRTADGKVQAPLLVFRVLLGLLRRNGRTSRRGLADARRAVNA